MIVTNILHTVLLKQLLNILNLEKNSDFRSFKSLYPHPYVAFADFESLNKKVPNEEQNSQQLATQHAFAFKYSIIDIRCKTLYKISKEKSYFGQDCINHFLSCISEDWKEISSKLNFPINFSPSDMQTHAEKKKCDICKSSFNKTNLKKTKHHFHYLEENNYAGTLCTPCNLKLKSPFFLPVIFHNLSYDLSLILKQYDEILKEQHISNISIKRKRKMRRVRRKRRRRFVKQEDIKTIFSHYFNQYKVRLLQVIIILIPFPTVTQ